MQAARYHGRGDIRVEDIDESELGSGQVRVDVDSCGICGSDLHEYAAGPIFIPEGEPHPISGDVAPVTMGHEYSGTVSDVGDGVTHLAVGDAVVINPILYCGECRQCREGNYHICDSIGFTGLSGGDGGFAENVVVSAEQAVPLVGDVPLEYGALVEPLAVGLHAVRRSGLQAGDSVAVFGSGPIGLSVIQSARAAGAGKIYVSEPRAARRDRAVDCGATDTIDPTETDAVEFITDETGGGVDVTFEVAGIEPTYKAALQSVRPSGTMTVVSIWEGEVSSHPNNIVLGERTITGTLAYLGGPRADEEYGMVIDMLADGTLDPEPLITDRIGLDDIVDDGFESLLDDQSDQVKILVKP
ncbi:(R,R)-butanediol dehydrogenase / meso-butanediol dehydrogenase / diacetyl reductase [Halogranum rubrum]|uniref:(R,R)-butanediol dehydrogenase / meso-butanediol dehydrogenase / diacetyl reductase n=1 Tax=Halogranum rubrum TaxID=553466 RepID=A0A1I4ET34_9EURY|nr:2,3-butanediol dehydrogenase [Halogranum rubrum]SFL08895.1 (R,R)-butanediol dehydrogenase / meso-butanediol dehydrogenase / diacetyl reductase [Halogranum rubrum]